MLTTKTREGRADFMRLMAGGAVFSKDFKPAFAHAMRMLQVATQSLADKLDVRLNTIEAKVDAKLANVKDGYTPIKGKDYVDGYTPVKGKDYTDGMPGQDADEKAIAMKVSEKVMPAIMEGIKASVPSMGTHIKVALESLNGGEKLGVDSIAGLRELLKEFEGKFAALGPGGGTTFALLLNGVQKAQQPTGLNFTGAGAPAITVQQNGTTEVNFPSSVGFKGSQEKSTTTPNGTLTTFTFTHLPLIITWNGAIQTLTDDYTVSGNDVTFTSSAGVPLANDKVCNIYA